MSDDELKELHAEIDRLFTNRSPITTPADGRSARRATGILLPLLVNIISLLVLLSGVWGVGQLLGVLVGRGERGAGEYQLTEGLVIRQVRQQAEEQLSASEARIAEIKRELDSLRRTGSGAQDTATRDRLSDLQNELAALQSAANVRLGALTARRQQQTFIVRQLQSIYQNIQTEVSERRLAPALDQIAAAETLLASNVSDPASELAAVAPALRAGNAVLRAAILYGQAVVNAANASDLPGKAAEAAGLVQMAERRAQAGDTIAAAELYARAISVFTETGRAYTEVQKITDAAHQREVSALAAQIDELNGRIDSLQTAVNEERVTVARQREELRLAAREAADLRATVQGERETVAKQLQALGLAGRQADDLRAAVQRERQTVARQREELGLVTQEVSNLQRRNGELSQLLSQRGLEVQRRTEELVAVIQSIQESTATVSAAPEPTSTADGISETGTKVVDLLKTKLTIRRLAESPEARQSFPTLANELDPFFSEYAATYLDRGRSSALDAVASALREVIVSLGLRLPTNPSVGGGPTVGLR